MESGLLLLPAFPAMRQRSESPRKRRRVPVRSAPDPKTVPGETGKTAIRIWLDGRAGRL